jgi:hypothetical protein
LKFLTGGSNGNGYQRSTLLKPINPLELARRGHRDSCLGLSCPADLPPPLLPEVDENVFAKQYHYSLSQVLLPRGDFTYCIA